MLRAKGTKVRVESTRPREESERNARNGNGLIYENSAPFGISLFLPLRPHSFCSWSGKERRKGGSCLITAGGPSTFPVLKAEQVPFFCAIHFSPLLWFIRSISSCQCRSGPAPFLTILTTSHTGGSFHPAALHTSPPVAAVGPFPALLQGWSFKYALSIHLIPPSALGTLKWINKTEKTHAILKHNWQAFSCVTRGREAMPFLPSPSSFYVLPLRTREEAEARKGLYYG